MSYTIPMVTTYLWSIHKKKQEGNRNVPHQQQKNQFKKSVMEGMMDTKICDMSNTNNNMVK